MLAEPAPAAAFKPMATSKISLVELALAIISLALIMLFLISVVVSASERTLDTAAFPEILMPSPTLTDKASALLVISLVLVASTSTVDDLVPPFLSIST